MIIDHVKERTWILSWYSGHQLPPADVLMVLNTRSFCEKLVQLLRHVAIMSKDQVKCFCNSRVCCECVGWDTRCDDYLYESRVAHDWKTEIHLYTSCARQREARGVELSVSSLAVVRWM